MPNPELGPQHIHPWLRTAAAEIRLCAPETPLWCRSRAELEQGETVWHYFQPAVVGTGSGWQIQVLNAHVCCHSPPGLSAHACCRALDRKTPLAQNPCVWTNCAVVATWIEWTATPATRRGQGQGAPETSKEQYAELLGLETSRSRRRDATERDTCQKSALGTKECLLTRVQTRPHHCCAELCFNVKCRTSLPSPEGSPRHRVVKSNLPTLETPGDVPPLWTVEPTRDEQPLQWAAVATCGPPSPHCRATHN